MPYELPDEPIPDNFLKLCVSIPNRREYVRAFLASYSGLARWTIWERDETHGAAIAAHYFLLAFNETVDNWTICEDDMTIINNYVSCGCGGGDSGSTPLTVWCVLQDGTVIPTPQPLIEPIPQAPPGLSYPIDPAVDPPPAGYTDWTAYDTAFCAASNGLWAAARALVVAAEGLGDVLALVTAVIVVISPLLPAGLLAAIGGVTFLEIIKELVTVIVSEQASDILNEIRDWLDDKREEIVCTLYAGRYDFRGVPAGLIMAASNYLDLSLSLEPAERNALQRFISALFSYQIILVGIADQTRIFDIPLPMVDCTTCTTGTVMYGWSKAEGVADVETVPAGLVYNGLGWIGGVIWSSVQANNYISYDTPPQNTDKLEWTISVAADSAGGAFGVNLNVPSGTTYVELVPLTLPGHVYTGVLALTVDQSFRSATASNGVKLSGWSTYARNNA
jgi:hypothetical protein